MQIAHQYKNVKIITKTTSGAGLILGNDLGNYFYMTDEKESRYQGFFYTSGKKHKHELEVFKVIDQINILDKGEIDEIKNNFFEVEKKYKNKIVENYFLPNKHNSLCLKVNKKIKAEIILDIKKPYDSREMGRFYEMEIKKDYVLIKFIKKQYFNKNKLSDKKEFTIYLAIKTDQNKYDKIGKFFSKYYQKDCDRNSYPWDRFVYKALELDFEKAVFTVSKNKKDVIDEVKNVFINFERLNKKESNNIDSKFKILNIRDEEIKMAHLCAQNSIDTLTVSNGYKQGVYAGLPWFFQFWHRDEAISLVQIYKINKKLAEKIIFNQIESITNNGQVSRKRFYRLRENELQSADALGWLANRIIKIDEKYKLPEKLKVKIIKKFEIATTNLIQKRTKNGLAISYKNETWMDSLKREYYCIEVQACRYSIYDLLYRFTNNKQYAILKNNLKDDIIERFYQDEIFKDCIDDNTVRPNIFILAYLIPNLLDKKLWEKCFDKILPKLYLGWGGLSTVDMTSDKFVPIDTGENSESYHNGNSWYWINNLVALILYKTNIYKYSKYINNIMETNTREILYKGIAGHHSEVSSANSQTHSGCEAQLWSSALYLEFFEEIVKY